VRGKEQGFQFWELNLLRTVAVENRLRNPTSLFWSERTLDRCIRGTIINFRAQGKEEDENSVAFLNKLFEFRKKVEFNQPKYRLGIQSSRSMVAQQPLRITLPGVQGAYQAKVVENMRRYMAISYPEGKVLPTGFSWKSQKVNVYFWRVDDAGYYFESKVLGDYLDRKFPILHIAHSDQLIRTQRRNSVRAELDATGRVFPLKSLKDADESFGSPGGYKCKMVDISEDGAAVLIGGRAKPGLPVKIETEAGESRMVLSGVVKGVTFKESKNVSILHIQANPPSPAMKNVILTYVYGIFQDKEAARTNLSSVAT